MGQLLVVKDDDDIDEEGRHATRLSTPRSAPAPPTRVCRRLCSRACSDLRQHGSMCSAFMVDLDGTICAGRGHRQWCLRTDNGAFDWSPSTFRRSMSRDASACRGGTTSTSPTRAPGHPGGLAFLDLKGLDKAIGFSVIHHTTECPLISRLVLAAIS
jgi:hypothetical protein